VSEREGQIERETIRLRRVGGRQLGPYTHTHTYTLRYNIQCKSVIILCVGTNESAVDGCCHCSRTVARESPPLKPKRGCRSSAHCARSWNTLFRRTVRYQPAVVYTCVVVIIIVFFPRRSVRFTRSSRSVLYGV